MQKKINKPESIFDSMLWVSVGLGTVYWIVDAVITVLTSADVASSFIYILLSTNARGFWLRWIVCQCLFLIFGSHVQYVAKKRRESEESLRESEERYLVLFAGTPDGIIVHDATGLILDANEAMVQILEIPRKALLGRHIVEFITSDNAANIGDNARITLAGQSNVFETTYVSASGNKIPVEVNEHRIKWMNGEAVLSISRDITERKQAEEVLRNSEKRFRELSIVDDLTQLYNSRHFYFQLKIELDRSNRYEQPLTLLLLDLDNFKAFNDTYGHVEGDQVLMRLGQVVKRCLRESDSAYRYGGEEFTILLPMTTNSDGAVTAERIRAEFKKENFSPVAGKDVHMTVSIGIAQYKPQEDMKTFVHRVDQFMYQGKKNGKDIVCSETWPQEQFKW
jgi:diguanylate cyclase (GGDEF)-like protein/PAS domain S-box-containing protein